MKGTSLLLATGIAAALLLTACHASGPDQRAIAALSAAPASLEMTAGSGTPATLTVTNQSSTVTASTVNAALPPGWSDVTEDASGCTTLAPQATCTLSFMPGNGSHPATAVNISGQDAVSTSATLEVSLPNSANITASGTPLSLVAGSGVSAAITVTNTSTVLTASNIQADLSGTPLQAAVTQDASACASVLPGASCSLVFTPINTAVTQTSFPIQGANTGQASGAIQIALPTSATITVAGSPLVLQATYGTPAPGTLTVTNSSTVLTATNISAQVAGTALAGALTQDASPCATLAPGASCSLSFTPGSAAVPATAVIVQGDNTSQADARVAINAPSQATISVTGSLALIAGGTAGTLTVTNTSATATAGDISATLTGTPLAGAVTEDASGCAILGPGDSCALSFTPGSNGVAQTAVAVAGTNTATVTADITVLAIGSSYQGGTVFQLPSGSQSGEVVSAVDVSSGVVWSNGAVTTGAQSNTDGAANTVAIITALGPGSYPAALCASYSATDGNGVNYGNGNGGVTWYLPAIDELNTVGQLYGSGTLSGFSGPNYWSSTEDSAAIAWAEYFASAGGSSEILAYKAANPFRVRCVHTF